MFIGIDIGGTTIKYGLVDDQGRVSTKNSVQTSHIKDDLIHQLVTIIDNYKDEEIDGVGISAPGIIQKNGLMTTAGSIHSLYGTNLKMVLEEKVNLPISIINDANAVAIAEKWIGNAKDFENYLCVVLGTGIGGGIVIDGKLFSGAHGMAGEFGWMLIDRLPKEDIEKVSYNQRAAVVGGLCHQYNLKKHLENLEAEDVGVYDAFEIMNRAKNGEKVAQSVLEQFYTDLSVGLMNLMCNFDPEAILIGGGISENEEFSNQLKQRLEELLSKHESFHRLKNIIQIPIIPTKLQNDAGMIGAVYTLKQFL